MLIFNFIKTIIILIFTLFIMGFLHETVHYLTAKIVGIETIELYFGGVSIKSINNKIRITISDFRNKKFIGCVFLRNSRITNEDELRKYIKKLAIVGASAPIFNYILVVIFMTIRRIYEIDNIFLDLVIVVNIFYACLSTLGDLKNSYLYLTDDDFLNYIVTETDLISGYYNCSRAKDFIHKRIEAHTKQMIGKDMLLQQNKYKLLSYKHLLYLFLAGEDIKLNENLFFYVLDNKNNINYSKNMTGAVGIQIIFYSIIYLYIYKDKIDICKELYQFWNKKSNLNNSMDNFLNEILIYFLYDEDNYTEITRECNKLIGCNKRFMENIIKRKNITN